MRNIISISVRSHLIINRHTYKINRNTVICLGFMVNAKPDDKFNRILKIHLVKENVKSSFLIVNSMIFIL